MTQLTQPMPITIYDSMSGQKCPFTPLEAGKVGIYVCGMTVYDYCHIGHARVMVGFDVVVRWLRHIGYDVNYVRNITDIDDKIINRAKENGESIYQLTDRFIKAMHEDADNLGCERPNSEPKATDFIPQMQIMPAAVDIEGVAQAASTHRRTFDMPTWATHTPRRLPFGLRWLCLFGSFPQYKVKRIFFVCLNIYALTGTRLHIG